MRSPDGVMAFLLRPLLVMWIVGSLCSLSVAEMSAGVAKVDITNDDAGPVNDRLYARALVIASGEVTAAIVSIDAVAIGEIGPIKNDYLGKVRGQIETELKIPPTNVLVNASHCHGIVCKDVDQRTIQAVKLAQQNMVPVRMGAGSGHENRIMENRRLKLKSGKELDVRHAYSLPPDDEVASVGPVDPQIGILRLDRTDGRWRWSTTLPVTRFREFPAVAIPQISRASRRR